MPRLVLPNSGVAYSLDTLLRAAGARLSSSGNARGLALQVPPSSVEAANTAGATLKAGPPNDYNTPTDITNPDVYLPVNGSVTYPAGCFIPLKQTFLKGSVNNQVVYCIVEL